MPLDPSDLAADLHARGELAFDAGDLVAAADLAERAASAFLELDGDHPDAANALLLCARVAHARSHYANALALARRGRAIVERARAAYPGEVVVAQLLAHTTAQVAMALQALGRPDEAEAALAAVLPIVEGELPGSRELAVVHGVLGICHKDQARFADAEARYARVAAVLDGLGEDVRVDRAALEHDLGGLFHARGELERAEGHARRAVEIREEALGPRHVALAADLAALAAVVCELDRFGEAEALLRRALAIFEAALEEPHFEIGFTLGSLGALHVRREQWDAARPLLERARTNLVALLGPEYVEVARVDRYLDELTSRRHASRVR